MRWTCNLYLVVPLLHPDLPDIRLLGHSAGAPLNGLLTIHQDGEQDPSFILTRYKETIRLKCAGPVVEPGPRRRPAEPQIVGSNPTRPAFELELSQEAKVTIGTYRPAPRS